MADHCGHFLIDSRNLSAAHNGRKLTYAEELESKSRSSVQVVAFEASESLSQQQQKNERLRPQEWETSKAHHLALLWMQCPGAALGRFVCFCDRKSNKRKKAKMATPH